MQHEFVAGIHSVQTCLEYEPQQVLEIYVLKEKMLQVPEAIQVSIKALDLVVQQVNKAFFIKHFHNTTHQGIAIRIKVRPKLGEADFKQFLNQLKSVPCLLILDGVQDPHNLGACFRSAEAAGIQAIVVPKNNAVGLSSIVRKTASGAADITPFFQVSNLVRTIEMVKSLGIWCVGLDLDSDKTLYQMDLKIPTAFVLGGEGPGMRPLTKLACDYKVKIPMLGKTQSLNVSVATGICLFECMRQRNSFGNAG